MRVLYGVVLFWCLLPVQAGQVYGDIEVQRVVSVYDADTIRVAVPGWPAVIGQNMPIRVLGIDAPELRGKCEQEKRMARAARAFTVEQLTGCKTIELKRIQRGKYFRLLADVYVDGVSLAQQLIDAGYARPYDGGTRVDWCVQ